MGFRGRTTWGRQQAGILGQTQRSFLLVVIVSFVVGNVKQAGLSLKFGFQAARLSPELQEPEAIGKTVRPEAGFLLLSATQRRPPQYLGPGF